uniref:Major Facilitator Superfamily, putative n=1 Tax=Theileria annulata TaxID=5874 RepID=A0A3B0NEU7_THEAN
MKIPSIIVGCFYLGGRDFKSLFYKARTYEDLTHNVEYINIFSVGATEYLDSDGRSDAIQNLFNIGILSRLMFALVIGVAVDQLGPKFTYVFAQLTQFIFWILLGVFPTNGTLVKACFFFIGATAEGTIIPLTTFAKKFKGNKALVIALTTCGIGLSNVFTLVLRSVFEKTTIREDQFYIIMIVYTVLTNLLCLVLGGLFVQNKLPDDKRSKADKPVVTFGDVEIIKLSDLSEDSLEDQEFGSFEGSFDINMRNYYLKKNLTSMSSRTTVKEKMMILYRRVMDFLTSKKFGELIISVSCMAMLLDSMEYFRRIKSLILVCSNGKDVSSLVKYFQYLRFIPAPLLGILIDRFGPEIVNLFTYFCMFMCYSLATIDSYGTKLASVIFYYLAFSCGIPGIYSQILYRFSNMYGTSSGLAFFFTGILASCKFPVYKILFSDSEGLKEWVRDTSVNLYIVCF